MNSIAMVREELAAAQKIALAAVVQHFREMMEELKPQQRLDLLEELQVGYCPQCGGDSPPGNACQCWNDE